MKRLHPGPCALLAALLFACAVAGPPPASTTGDRAMQLTPAPELPFLFGPATADASALVQWLGRQRDLEGRPATTRLPVALRVTGPGGVGEAQVVTGSAETLPLTVDDLKLGVSLADRFRQSFPGASSGALWLEGTFEDGHFSVSRVCGPVDRSAAAPPLYARVEAAFARPDLVALVDRLGSVASMAEKEDAGRALVAAGVEAIPVLILALGDGRPYEERDIANRMNLPPNASVEPFMAVTTVGRRCEDLLHAIITPAVESPPAGNFKVYSTQVLRIDDWRAFWEARRGMTLPQIHDELRPLARAYWEAHGTTQTVISPPPGH